MSKLVKFSKRYEVYSVILGHRFLEGSTNNLRKAKKMAREEAETHGKAELVDTKEEDE